MHYVRDNVLRVYSKFQDFRTADQYTDVTIECTNASFKCHKVILASASRYFNTIFSSDFKESREGKVVLQEIEAKTLEEILQFIYTGYVDVNSDNFYSLLQAGEYFEIAGVEDLCAQFIQTNRIMGETIFDIIRFALKTHKKTLQHFLIRDMRAQLKILMRNEKFLKMPFDDLCELFDQLLPVNEEVLCTILVQWVEYSREERRQYFGQLVEKYHFENISMPYQRFLISNLYNRAAIPLLSHDENPELLVNRSARRDETCYIFVKNVEETFATIFCATQDECSIFDRIKLQGRGTNDHRWIQSVVLDNFYVYSLRYIRGNSNEAVGDQSFTLQPLVNMHSARSLEPPPLIFEDVRMCSLQNCIYMANRNILDQCAILRTNSSSAVRFNNEEIGRGIYLYNCELNKWFPVPSMQIRVEDASIVSCDNILYSFGHKTNTLLQAYDPRTGKWQMLPRCNFFRNDADCCVLGGKIYVCGGSRAKGNVVERYDPRAKRWEKLADMSRRYRHHKVVAFSNEIWAMGNYVNGVPDNQTSIEIYDPNKNSWGISSILTNAIEENSTTESTCTVLDCVVL